MAIIIEKNTMESAVPVGTDVTPATGGNSGGAAGTYFPNAYKSPTGGVLKYSDVAFAGEKSILTQITAAAGSTFGWRPGTADVTDLFFRVYVRFAAFSTGPLFLITARDNTQSASGYSVRVSATGNLSVYRRAATTATLATMADALNLNAWYRVEGRFNVAGDWEVRVYEGDSLVQFSPAIKGSGQTSIGLTFYDYLNFGVEGTSATATAYWDEPAWGTDWIGPLPSPVARPLDTKDAPGWVLVGSKPTPHESLSDQSNATGVRSPALAATGIPVNVRLSAVAAGSLRVKVILSASEAGADAIVKLYQSSTLIASWTTLGVSVTPTLYTYALTASQEGAVTERDDLRVTVEGLS